VPIRETRLDRAATLAPQVVSTLLAHIKTARHEANLSQDALARRLSWPQTRYSRFERNVDPITVHDVCLVAVLLGLKPRFDLYRAEEGLRDQGHTRLIARFVALLSPLWHVMVEAPFPTLGDLRSWDVFLRLVTPTHRTGVEAETRVRDQQELVRRIRQRDLHGGVDTILVLLSDSAHNRAAVAALRDALGPDYHPQPQAIIAALRAGVPLPGSGVILL
jgi:transcriptional regulator with XRE-family HTH domain